MCERLAGGKEERLAGKRNGEQKAWTGREEAARTQREKADGEERGGKSHGRACERLAYGGGGEGFGEEKRRTEGADGVRRSRACAEEKSRRGRGGQEKSWTGREEAARTQREKADKEEIHEQPLTGRGKTARAKKRGVKRKKRIEGVAGNT